MYICVYIDMEGVRGGEGEDNPRYIHSHSLSLYFEIYRDHVRGACTQKKEVLYSTLLESLVTDNS